METIQVIEYLGEFGAIGIFCVFLLYLHKKSEQRLNDMQREHNKHIEALRARYDAIIEQYRQDRDKALLEITQEREKLHKVLVQKLESLANSFNKFATQLDTISDQIDKATNALHDLHIESKARILSKRVG
jgi:type I restriction-modification system DNA methylase subunit